jgi:hypothetical protein
MMGSAALHNAKWYLNYWIIYWKGYGDFDPIQGILPAFP